MSARRTLFAALAMGLSFAAPALAQTAMADANSTAPFGMAMNDQRVYSHLLLDQFEDRATGADHALHWDAEGWVGTDSDRLWLKSEGTLASNGKVEDGRHELLYAKPISPYFDVQGGVRYDLDSRPGRGWAALGVEGLAPYLFDVSATLYASDGGRYAARLSAAYDLLLTQRLILTPQIEANLYAKNDPARRVGSGLSDIDSGLRLRYEITRKFAPYVGVSWERKFGTTADFARADGEQASDLRFAFGVRTWF